VADRSPLMERGIAVRVAVLAVLLLGTTVWTLGPLRHAEASTRAEIAGLVDELERWESGLPEDHAAQEDRWADAWQRLRRRWVPIPDDSVLMSVVGRVFDGPSLRRLEIERTADFAPPGASPLETGELPTDDAAWEAEGGREAPRTPVPAIEAPDGGQSLRVVEIPVRVQFSAEVRDARSVLATLEGGRLPLRVESLALRADEQRVEVEIHLTWFGREDGSS